MTKADIYRLIATGEGLHLDFKRSMSGSHANTMVSFANARGGQIILGIEDEGSISGYELTNKKKSQIQDIARTCDPPVHIDLEEVMMGNDRVITVITIPASVQAPHRSTNGFYLRQGASTVKMRTEDISSYIEQTPHRN